MERDARHKRTRHPPLGPVKVNAGGTIGLKLSRESNFSMFAKIFKGKFVSNVTWLHSIS